jgi:exonuclease SbcD
LPGAVFTPARAGHQPGRPLRSGKSSCCAISDYYQQQYQQPALRGDRPLPIIASGHLTTVGASKSDAVRDIYIGTLDAFPAQHFRPPTTLRWAIFTGRRWSAAAKHIRYSGSPLPLSFDETGKAKSVHLVSLATGASAPWKPWRCPSPSRWR